MPAAGVRVHLEAGPIGEVVDALRSRIAGAPLGVAVRQPADALEAIEHGADEAMMVRPDDQGAARELVDRTTLRARVRREQENLRASLAHAEKLTALGTLVAGVAHEINNPLSALTLSLEVAQRDLETPLRTLDAVREAAQRGSGLTREEVQGIAAGARQPISRADIDELIDNATQAALSIAMVVRDLRLFARADEDETPSIVDVAGLVDQVLRLLGREVESVAIIERDHGSEVPPILVARSRLTQVLTNVVVNAVHAMRDVERPVHRLRVSTRFDDDAIAITVSDTGPGIPSEDLERIFDPFYTTKRAELGTGLGLSISRSILRRLGGELLVESVLGDGATFVALIPRTPREVLASAANRRVQELSVPVPRERRAVMLIDDDEQVLRACARVLGRHYDLVVARDGQEAIELLSSGSRADVIVTDTAASETLSAWLLTSRPELTDRLVHIGVTRPHSASIFVGKPFATAALLRAIELGAAR
jgi:signal transduction histidine kinase/CheY-like chemotaxis protein